ncbi:armadillo-type protein [Cantharellus anzutake]|uniref:armadillo-type protein n=1 Tax=Cantharellus anzutake TaxID=1750568 RepID=UPI0019068104|nr:armadillo-type protein [Cantharellus anzutake]KAF8326346.1 armadillo-type protein [Cantharellus anzutake]
MEEGATPVEEDFSSLPLSERLAHKNWKARVHGYEELIRVFQKTGSEDDPAFRPYIQNPDLLKKMVIDANVVAQEKGVEAVRNFIQYSGEYGARTRDSVIPALVDKCFGSTRAGTKAKAIEIALEYVAAENTGEGVLHDIFPGIGAKQPKAVAGSVKALGDIFRAFGPKIVPPQPILKALPKIFGHTDKTVRSDGAVLAQALHVWLGPALQPALSELKPVQVKELNEVFARLDADGQGHGTGKQDKFTKAQERERAAAAVSTIEGDEPEAEGEQVAFDAREFAEEIDIFPKIPQDFQAQMNSSKWKDRKEALDATLDVVKVSVRIKDAEGMGELLRALARRMTDANVMCVMTAANIIGGIAKGVGQPFSKYKSIVMPPMIERFKERKANVVEAISNGLDEVFATTTFPDITEDLLNALHSKNPQVKEASQKFANRCLSTTKIPPAKADIKPLMDAMVGLLSESSAPLRESAMEGLGISMKILGERAMNPFLEPVDDIKKAKIKEAYEKTTVKCKIGGTAPPPPKPAPAPIPAKRAPPKRSPVEITLEEEATPPKPAAKPPARLLARRTVGAGSEPSQSAAAPPKAIAAKKPPPVAVSSASAKSSKAPAPVPPSESFKFKFTPEDAESRFPDLVPNQISSDLGDSAWKVRLAALDEAVPPWIDSIVDDTDCELLIRFFAKKPGWNEKNFQVSAKVFGVLSTLAERSPTFSKACVALATPPLIEKLGDIKLKKPAGDALLVFGERFSLSFVLSQAYDPINKLKAPKTLADAVAWVNVALTDFGIVGLPLRPLVEFLKTALKNSNAAVRSSATATLVTLRLFAGVGIKDLLEDLNPQLQNTIQVEFDKVEGQEAPVPTRTSSDVAATPAVGLKGKSTSEGDPLDELFPRVDLEKLVSTTNILLASKSEAWKERKEALENLIGILEVGTNKRLKPNLGDIAAMLKGRLSDLNKAVQLLALDAISKIAIGMNKPFEKYCKVLVLPVAQVTADQKANVRVAGTTTLSAIAQACEGLEAMAHFMGTALESPNPLQRSTLLGWLTEWLKEYPATSTIDMSNWVSPVLAALEDRSPDVRKSAQALLPSVIIHVGVGKVLEKTNTLKAASRSAIIPLINSAAAPNAAPPDRKPAPSGKNALKVAPTADEPAGPTTVTSIPPQRKGLLARKFGISSPRPTSRAGSGDERLDAPNTPFKSKVTSLKRPASAVSKAVPPASAPLSVPFSTANVESKRSRLSKDGGRWIIESGPTRKDLGETLQHHMEPHCSGELLALLFSKDHHAVNDHVSGLGVICDMFEATSSGTDSYGVSADIMSARLLANIDLPLKYVSLRIHEPQPNLINKCLDVIDNAISFMANAAYALNDLEAATFIPTIIHKASGSAGLGDAREVVRQRVQKIIEALPKVFSSSRLFAFLLEHGLRAKVAKTRGGALDEMAIMIKKKGMSVCEPSKVLPVVAALVDDKDAAVRKSALSVIGECYILEGEKVWQYLGRLDSKIQTQVEEKLRRLPNAAKAESAGALTTQRTATATPRPGSPALPARKGSIPPPSAISNKNPRTASPSSPLALSGSPTPQIASSPTNRDHGPSSPSRPRSIPTSRLAAPRTRPLSIAPEFLGQTPQNEQRGLRTPESLKIRGADRYNGDALLDQDDDQIDGQDEITIIISSILSSDPSRSVEALKKIQKILDIPPEAEPSSLEFQALAGHTDGLIETITLQMAHVFERSNGVDDPKNYRLAKHLIQTMNAFCDHTMLAETMPVDILTSLLEELTMRLLQTDESSDGKVKDLSRFINMIILRLFSTAKRINIFRSLFNLLLQIVRPFSKSTASQSKEARLAELVLKCMWKLARGIPADLDKGILDPTEIFPALETFLQTIPPNEWRARAATKIPVGDMPLRTIKVVIQHIVGAFGDEVYDQLSVSFDDPSATIVYPYVYRILNSANAAAQQPQQQRPTSAASHTTSNSYAPSVTTSAPSNGIHTRPISPEPEPISRTHSKSQTSTFTPTRPRSGSASAFSGRASSPSTPNGVEPDPDAKLMEIFGHISSDTTGALHKEGITELYHFLKAYPHKQARADKMLDSTGPAFRKYLARALASRAAEEEERRGAAVADTLSRLESGRAPSEPTSPKSTGSYNSPRRVSGTTSLDATQDPALSRLHELFRYHGRNSVIVDSRRGSVTSSSGHGATLTEPVQPKNEIPPPVSP